MSKESQVPGLSADCSRPCNDDDTRLQSFASRN
jgi:hypothetical protein